MENIQGASKEIINSHIKMMKKFIIIDVITIAIYNIFIEVEDIVYPSDSGDMMWLNIK